VICTYNKNLDGKLWWCNTHGRKATHLMVKRYDNPNDNTAVPCCAPYLGGVMIPCRCVDLTSKANIVEDKKS
jgi:hypothetical protein